MTNINNELTYLNFEQSIEFILTQFKKDINVALPATIQSYDSQTKRATVIPAVQKKLTDDTLISYTPISDIPVVMPCGGGYTLSFPVKTGDTVLLVFCQRGIDGFKKNFSESAPSDSLMDIHDAVAITGFGGLSVEPASSAGASLQNESGANALIVEDSQVEIKKGDNDIVIKDDEIVFSVGGSSATLKSNEFSIVAGGSTIKVDSAGLTINGIIFDTHYHIGNQGSPTSPPQN